VVLGFRVGGNAAIAVHHGGSGVVGGERQLRIAEFAQHQGEVARRAIKVLEGVGRVDAELFCPSRA
jgi:hypothetical protein